eukprot:3806606-Karenia_brevis.AAC.1
MKKGLRCHAGSRKVTRGHAGKNKTGGSLELINQTTQNQSVGTINTPLGPTSPVADIHHGHSP